MNYREAVDKHMLWMRRKAAWRLQDLGIFWILAGCFVAVLPTLPAYCAWGAGVVLGVIPYVRNGLATVMIRKYRAAMKEMVGDLQDFGAQENPS